MNIIEDSLEKLREYIEKENFKGFDPYDGLNSRIPFEKFGKPEDVANLVLFLVSDRSSYITGECIRVSGGW